MNAADIAAMTRTALTSGAVEPLDALYRAITGEPCRDARALRHLHDALVAAHQAAPEMADAIVRPGDCIQAAKPLPDVRVGDVWRTTKGQRDARVERVFKAYTFLEHRKVTKVVARLKTGAELACEIHNFVKGRVLIERDGKPAEG